MKPNTVLVVLIGGALVIAGLYFLTRPRTPAPGEPGSGVDANGLPISTAIGGIGAGLAATAAQVAAAVEAANAGST